MEPDLETRRAQQERLAERRREERERGKATAGIVFGVTIVLFTLGGFALDRQLGPVPLFLLVGLGLGFVGGFIHLVETVSPGTLFRGRRKQKDDESETGA